jgi:Tol biopolymer transport system component
MMASLRRGAGLREAANVWVLFGLVALEVFATYARLPTRDLYHVSGSGVPAGLGRALVLVNFPVALAALGVLPVVADRLWPVALAAAALCAVLFWPGVVDQADLDAKWINGLPAAGVAIALALTLWQARRGFGPPRRVRGDGWRLAIALVLLLVSLPWLAADLGVDLPGLGVFVTDEWWAPFGHARLYHAVHHGHHHGVDGTYLALTSLVLSRTLGRLRRPLRTALAVYLGILFAYGVANIANDGWYEQVVKRDVTVVALPSVLLPSVSVPWAVIVAAGAIVAGAFLRAAEPGIPAPPRVPAFVWLVPAGVAGVGLAVLGSVQKPERPAGTPLAASRSGRLVFPMSPKASWHLYAIRADGRGLRRLTNGGFSDLAPDVSPSGRIAFQSNRDDDADVFVSDATGSARERITRAGRDGEPAWAPDGRRIALIRDGDLYVVSTRGTRVRKLAGRAAWPTWAPGGSVIAYETERHGRGQIAVVALDGGGHATLLSTGDNRFPVWSPRGDLIAFECREGDHWHICLLDPGSGRHHLLTGGESDEFAPAWSSDAKRIAFVGDRDGNDQLYVMKADGGGVVRLTSGQADKEAPAWRP